MSSNGIDAARPAKFRRAAVAPGRDHFPLPDLAGFFVPPAALGGSIAGMSQPTSQPKRILHIDFNLADLNAWMEGKSHEEIGRIITAIGLASQASDEAYLEQWSFIDRIVYGDGTMRKLIRGSGNIDDVSGIDRPIAKDAEKDDDDDAKGRKASGGKRGQSGKRIHT